MNINFELLDLRAFLAIVDLGSFRKASEALNISQPALTRRIKTLEYRIGNQLLERSTRYVSLTNVGRELEPLMRRTLAEIDEQLSPISSDNLSRAPFISIACIPTSTISFLPQAIGHFHKSQPRVRFRVHDTSSAHVLECVSNGSADFGITFIGQADKHFTFTPLFDDEFAALTLLDDPITETGSTSWRQLSTRQLIGVNRSSGNRTLLDTRLAKIGVKMNWTHEVNHLSTAIGLVKQGVGISVLPRLAYKGTPMGNLSITPIVEPVISRALGIIERRGVRRTHLVQSFLDTLML